MKLKPDGSGSKKHHWHSQVVLGRCPQQLPGATRRKQLRAINSCQLSNDHGAQKDSLFRSVTAAADLDDINRSDSRNIYMILIVNLKIN